MFLLDKVNRWTEKECHDAVMLDWALHTPRLRSCPGHRQTVNPANSFGTKSAYAQR